MPRGNPQNLVPVNTRSKEEQRKLRSKAGKIIMEFGDMIKH